MGIRRISNRELAKMIDRGSTYINSRIKDESEWALGDIERLCQLWGMTPCQLIESVQTADDLADRIASDPSSFDLAANHNPDKEKERTTPRE